MNSVRSPVFSAQPSPRHVFIDLQPRRRRSPPPRLHISGVMRGSCYLKVERGPENISSLFCVNGTTI
ncbi:hypothetical protein RchiOBHm_Chr2g0089151 [Rosa chinensis]|uniref:Uncharacterized protein n=1 Tax=Rosa chinensis TaxID=74649 RepID=A0A2P6RJ47_ROSCH|nr:hypothetical protein RchiOBHm_Chr2g0089151 [Rosa chinensis]